MAFLRVEMKRHHFGKLKVDMKQRVLGLSFTAILALPFSLL